MLLLFTEVFINVCVWVGAGPVYSGVIVCVCVCVCVCVWVQVLYKTGRVLGETEVTVSSDKVTVERLDLDIISGLTLTVDVRTNQPRALVARLTENHQLNQKYQVSNITI